MPFARYSRLLVSFALAALFCACCSSQPDPRINALDLSADRQLWSIYTQIMAVRRDAEETFKDKDITPQEAEACFKRNEEKLKRIAKELAALEIKEKKNYSPALRRLVNSMEKAVFIARKTYAKKRICDIKGAKKTLETISQLSGEIPVQRTYYLIQAGCSTEQIYEIFRQDGFKDEDIQKYILQAMKSK